ncbi:racemase, putative [Acanthamoeba castellanii str. Neff]|uniref:Racemase, putative n=1 Tax=Acanthamoeba castellanii (strain ATCC 30010 / Neff) TaxID=1257118 RepID=L8H0A2_ACACF|nr:racemase, putative [Acanthamoeba castellanii str. Neff]ELR18627.1 racemase, putative [Acanthamoeba castellanii str. Neff]
MEYGLELRAPFGTSHSSTSRRENALIEVWVEVPQQDGSSAVTVGVGEVGLPPKKPAAGYLSDFADVEGYPFKVAASAGHFSALRGITSFIQGGENPDEFARLVRTLLRALDEEPANVDPASRFARSGIEAAVLDLFCVHSRIPLHQLIGIDVSKEITEQGVPLGSSFYTIALNPDVQFMLQQARSSLSFTPYLKIKLDSNIEQGTEPLCTYRVLLAILNGIKKIIEEEFTEYPTWKLCIDANGAWNPEGCIEMLKVLKPLSDHIYMLEQPFPTTLLKEPSEAGTQAWKVVKAAYENAGIPIFADESMSTAADLPLLLDFVHGVNVKLEKAGGVRAALEALLQAQKFNLKLWIGIMVGSRVNCGTGAHLLPLATHGDLDGSLLTTEDSQVHEGGFVWGEGQYRGTVFLPTGLHGIGVRPKPASAH